MKISKDGSVTVEPPESSVYMRCSTDGFVCDTPWGQLVFNALGLHVLHRIGARFDIGPEPTK